MRVMVLVKADPQSEAGEMPSRDLFQKMAKYNQELIDAGVLVDGGGLFPSSKGVRVKFFDGQTSVSDGPFTQSQAHDLIAGYWIFDVDNVDQAVEWIRKAPFDETDIEIRPLMGPEDFDEEITREVQQPSWNKGDELGGRH